MAIPKLTFPEYDADAVEFPYEIDGVRYEIPPFSEVYGGFGIDSVLRGWGEHAKKAGADLNAAVFVALQGDEDAIKKWNMLLAKQQVEFFKQWGEFTGADLPES